MQQSLLEKWYLRQLSTLFDLSKAIISVKHFINYLDVGLGVRILVKKMWIYLENVLMGRK